MKKLLAVLLLLVCSSISYGQGMKPVIVTELSSAFSEWYKADTNIVAVKARFAQQQTLLKSLDAAFATADGLMLIGPGERAAYGAAKDRVTTFHGKYTTEITICNTTVIAGDKAYGNTAGWNSANPFKLSGWIDALENIELARHCYKKCDKEANRADAHLGTALTHLNEMLAALPAPPCDWEDPEGDPLDLSVQEAAELSYSEATTAFAGINVEWLDGLVEANSTAISDLEIRHSSTCMSPEDEETYAELLDAASGLNSCLAGQESAVTSALSYISSYDGTYTSYYCMSSYEDAIDAADVLNDYVVQLATGNELADAINEELQTVLSAMDVLISSYECPR